MKNKAADLPPILPNVQDILKEYLICPDRLPIHEYERNQEYWPREPDIPTLFDFDRVPCGTTLKVQRDPNTGKIIEFREVPVTQVIDRFTEFRDGPLSFPLSFRDLSNPIAEIQDQTIDFTELLSVPPGFERGLQFAKDGFTVITEPEMAEENNEEIQLTDDETDNTVNLMALINQEQDLLGLWTENKSATTNVKLSEQPTLDIHESEVLPTEPEIHVLNITKTRAVNKGTDWAVKVDIEQPVNDFQERIPKMAIEYEFELDTFQKQAIIKLEEHCDVFVAAHTSAGKTVVAEYAIALSQKHKTRTIYTSPIKALSNQKYRDFKNKFEDVGLVTGDIQINQTGVCLIMTTEILRSMLYRASDIIADLEYVIFDEVHYINDAERGYIWEEVLILLPDHVRIVLLSATVPNAMDFANWLGVTKQRKVYVISTSKRPVPLKHYLYTGIGGKTKDERFLLVDEDEKMLVSGYAKAQKAHAASHGTGGKFIHRQTQERRSLMGLIDHLQRHELLPVVAFTFSRAKCDRITDELHNLSLTTFDEKRRIESFFRMCVEQLKEPDRQLPQVLKMQAVLVNGIGVHHSGILPIIKEIVEILFSNGLVKVLFATETFAMGVNMPARTVVFNSIKKFDGKEMRCLKPGEYIQMAGRAGRRGKDQNGTVIIRCADDVLPDLRTLREITQGKPQKLESKFRLTYSLILNALRLESWVWTVESVMLHSFHEVNHVTKADALKVELERTEAALAEEMSRDYGEHLHKLVGFYKAAAEYIEEWNIVQPKLMEQARVVKEMIPGRVLVISHEDHYNKLAILLSTRKGYEPYKVLVLANQQKQPVSDEIHIILRDAVVEQKEQPQKKPDKWYRMLSYTHEDIFQPDGAIGHEVLDITAVDVTRITDKTIKIDCELVLKDWSKRQIPRFRDDPPGQTCQQAIQQLAKLTTSVLNNADDANLQYLMFPVKDITLSQEVDYMNAKKKDLITQINCTKIANFEEQFYTVFKREHLEEKLKILKFEMSSRSLSLYPQYMDRMEVLTQLEHINEQKRVLPKGNVARKMSMNELLITELVLRNTLTHLQPCEIAALLSALVFQVKVKDNTTELPHLTDSLNKGMKEIAAINKELRDLELRYKISNANDELNFGLVAFVNEWAREKPFADIMDLTDIQEGIIVRCILQLNETLKDVREAASKFGNSELPTKIDEAMTAIKRDIVFAASLYTQNKEITVSPPNPKLNETHVQE
ncbi:twister [Carabus blaptoides fortunei]